MGWLVESVVGGALGLALGLFVFPKLKSGPQTYWWFLKAGIVAYAAVSTWDLFSGGKNSQAMLPILFGIVVIIGITAIIDQLEEIKRYLVDHQTRPEKDKEAEEFYGQVKRLLVPKSTQVPADQSS